MTPSNPFIDLQLLERYGPRLLEGLWVTVQLVSVSFVLGAVLGTCIALGRMSRSAVLNRTCAAYIYFFRGSPLLAQLFLLYYGLGSLRELWQDLGLWWLFREAWYCTLLAFTLNSAAYQAEILRGSLQSLAPGQREAARALGLGPVATFFKVLLPQMAVVAIGPLGNELILMIKASAIASMVTLYDLMGAAKLGFSRSFDFQIYLWAAVLYLVLVESLRRLLKHIDQRLSRHLR
ncbi:ABC transporter permease subunit [Pseudomonas sp. HR96]|uniref:ABC transporter permease n=1 Tax=Pseudomonas sp. HR96 TaxID=1027966 RepID=UPI002A7510BB|nr:ABC transporter permease subunit [Pseudomonas sp. HR96]WPO99358.1 ABC transporter permease subunit [Pseudomonas sp. HR96]